MRCCGIVISGCIRECASGNINRGCSRCTWRKSCGINGRAGGSKIRYSTTGYGDVCCSKVGGRFASGKGDGKSSIVGGCAIGNGGATTVSSGDGHGRRYVIIYPVKLSSSRIVITGRISKSIGGNINGGCACSAWRKGCGINGRTGGCKIRYSTTGNGDVCCSEVSRRFASGKGNGQCAIVGGRTIGNGSSTAVSSGNGHGRRYVIVGPVELRCCGIVISGCVRKLISSHIDRSCASSAWRKGCGVNG